MMGRVLATPRPEPAGGGRGGLNDLSWKSTGDDAYDSETACGMCQLPLEVGQKVTRKQLGKNWHSDCFKCAECLKPIPQGEKYLVRKGTKKPLCEYCANNVENAGDNCTLYDEKKAPSKNKGGYLGEFQGVDAISTDVPKKTPAAASKWAAPAQSSTTSAASAPPSASSSASSRGPRKCGSCGAQTEGRKFCESCGAKQD